MLREFFNTRDLRIGLSLALIAVFCGFVAPYDPETTFIRYKLAPPTKVYNFPFVYEIVRTRDPETMRNIYTENTETIFPIKLFTKGTPYKFWGLWETDVHLFGLDVQHEKQGITVFGADRLGRDLFSRMIYGARISLSIGLVSVFLSLALGVFIGGISGYYGGTCPFHLCCAKKIVGVCDVETPPVVEVEPGDKVRCVLYKE